DPEQVQRQLRRRRRGHHLHDGGDRVDEQVRVVEVVDRLRAVVPVELPLHRVQRVGEDRARDLQVRGVVDVDGLAHVERGRHQPDGGQRDQGPPPYPRHHTPASWRSTYCRI